MIQLRRSLSIYCTTTLAIASAALALGACSSSSASTPSGGSNGATSGGGNGTAGMGGPLTAADAVVTGSVMQCAGTMPKQLPDTQVNECLRDGCSQAACVPGDLIQQFVPTADLTLLATCDASTYCLPIDFIATTGDFQAKPCTSLVGAEGRCLSTCIPQVAERMDQLPVADCAMNERCAPCYDPITGDDTKACEQGCDMGPTQPAVTFASCGNGLGLCVPGELVPPDLQSSVPVADCTQEGFVCAPTTHVNDINAQFDTCTPTSDLLMAAPPLDGPNGEKGGCVPAYLVENFMPPPPDGAVLQDDCPDGFLCAPCTNPLANQEPTGACPLQ